ITRPLKRRPVKLPVFSVEYSDAEVSRLRCVLGISNNAGNATTINTQPTQRKPTGGITSISQRPVGAPRAVAPAVVAPKSPSARPTRLGTTVEGTTAVPLPTRTPKPRPPII